MPISIEPSKTSRVQALAAQRPELTPQQLARQLGFRPRSQAPGQNGRALMPAGYIKWPPYPGTYKPYTLAEAEHALHARGGRARSLPGQGTAAGRSITCRAWRRSRGVSGKTP
jgi:hypothetical protein